MRLMMILSLAAVVLGLTVYHVATRSSSSVEAAARIDRASFTARSSNDNIVASAQDKLRKDPSNVESNTTLGQAYLQKARETGDPSYYTKAEALFDRALAGSSNDAAALIGKAALAMSRHDFRNARILAEKEIALNPDIVSAYGVLTDAQIELGAYDDAERSLSRMVQAKPNLSSYSRISYLRELHGDTEGAIQAMRMAIDSGAPEAENTAWCIVQLGNLYLNSGKLDLAAQQYAAALSRYPDYVHAIGGQARLATAKGDDAAAVAYYKRAIAHVPLPEFVIGLGDVYSHMGKTAEAREQYDLVKAIEQIYRSNGVSVDIEMALFDADHGGNLNKALAVAKSEWDWRKSVRVADVYAWTLYRSGRYEEAAQMMHEALRLGSKDPLLLRHASAIYSRAAN